jgi:hypothetical protein
MKIVLIEQQSNHYFKETIKEISSLPSFKMHGSQLMNSCITILQLALKLKEKIEKCVLICVTWIKKGRRKIGILKSKPRLLCVIYISKNMEVNTFFLFFEFIIFS